MGGVKSERWDEALALVRAELVPVFERQPGFLRLLLIGGDAHTGRGMTTTFWQAADHVRALGLITWRSLPLPG